MKDGEDYNVDFKHSVYSKEFSGEVAGFANNVSEHVPLGIDNENQIKNN